ncbi:hypothetical protein BO94DRAFT_590167 [Aspergillus sclerotioniger CBS 115572]|uniref:Uncharacterized protein n=1 Tax=Aspergillus sclerotioniger CBS 115572 TaxID=1450535 RepID=A0A317VD85_9EURO|nr:hypothetical protein BO94DRAFT_590167 [Aspergillus sclerotioniger CBS 115572]PWY70852.1 hypothetical protein BO94DRAFT_590167 [Aspergillus sclerotioniger CBS 115572]
MAEAEPNGIRLLCRPSTADFPLRRFHRIQHQYASTLLIQLYWISLFGTIQDESTHMRGLLDALDSLNEETRQLNIEKNLAPDLGIVDIDIFLHAWKNRNLWSHLPDFCRLRCYPLEGSRRPPVLGSDYQPYHTHYWELIDRKAPEALLQIIWELRKTDTDTDTIEDTEILFESAACVFNRRLGRLHKMHGNGASDIGYLRPDETIIAYQKLEDCLAVQDKEGYRKCRNNLRYNQALFGYPAGWLPGPYEEEACQKTSEISDVV